MKKDLVHQILRINKQFLDCLVNRNGSKLKEKQKHILNYVTRAFDEQKTLVYPRSSERLIYIEKHNFASLCFGITGPECTFLHEPRKTRMRLLIHKPYLTQSIQVPKRIAYYKKKKKKKKKISRRIFFFSFFEKMGLTFHAYCL